MAAAAKASAALPFELKSATLAAVALLLKTSDIVTLAAAMTAQFGDAPTMFDHDPVIIDLTSLPADGPGIDFEALAALLRRQRLLPVAVRGGSEDQRLNALRAGLSEAAPAGPLPTASAIEPAHGALAEPPAGDDRPSFLEPSSAEPSSAEPSSAEPSSAELSSAEPSSASLSSATPNHELLPLQVTSATTLTIDKPLRSGQQVYARGGDLIVLAAVNFGAEVLADGNIHVYGPLRGKAVAGAKGNADARIFSTCMEPELVAIAGTYRTTETPLPAEVLGKPAQIRLDGDRLVFEPLA